MDKTLFNYMYFPTGENTIKLGKNNSRLVIHVSGEANFVEKWDILFSNFDVGNIVKEEMGTEIHIGGSTKKIKEVLAHDFANFHLNPLCYPKEGKMSKRNFRRQKRGWGKKFDKVQDENLLTMLPVVESWLNSLPEESFTTRKGIKNCDDNFV